MKKSNTPGQSSSYAQSYTFEGVGIVGTATDSRITQGRISIDLLPEVLFPAPKVIPEPPPTIDQLVASAKSRLRVFIQAETDWLSLKIKKDFQELRDRNKSCFLDHQISYSQMLSRIHRKTMNASISAASPSSFAGHRRRSLTEQFNHSTNLK